MPKSNTHGHPTAEAIREAQRSGKLDIAADITCPFCEGGITIKEDARGVSTPFCRACGVFLALVWRVTDNGCLRVRLNPKSEQTSDELEAGSEETPILRDAEPEYETPVPIQAPEHKDVAGQLMSFMTERESPATTRELLDALDCTRESLNKAAGKLMAAGQLQRVKRGIYELMTYGKT